MDGGPIDPPDEPDHVDCYECDGEGERMSCCGAPPSVGCCCGGPGAMTDCNHCEGTGEEPPYEPDPDEAYERARDNNELNL